MHQPEQKCQFPSINGPLADQISTATVGMLSAIMLSVKRDGRTTRLKVASASVMLWATVNDVITFTSDRSDAVAISSPNRNDRWSQPVAMCCILAIQTFPRVCHRVPLVWVKNTLRLRLLEDLFLEPSVQYEGRQMHVSGTEHVRER